MSKLQASMIAIALCWATGASAQALPADRAVPRNPDLAMPPPPSASDANAAAAPSYEGTSPAPDSDQPPARPRIQTRIGFATDAAFGDRGANVLGNTGGLTSGTNRSNVMIGARAADAIAPRSADDERDRLRVR